MNTKITAYKMFLLKIAALKDAGMNVATCY